MPSAQMRFGHDGWIEFIWPHFILLESFMRLAVFAALAATLASTAAMADPIQERQDLMKERGAMMRILGPIAQGNQPFDADAVIAALNQLHENAQTLDVDVHFAPETATGDTKAAPAIWEDFEAFRQQDAEYDAAVAAAVEAQPQDLDALRTAFGPIGASCGACHETYRLQ
jgi:cytochrome c556